MTWNRTAFVRKLRGAVHELDEAVFPSSIYCLCCGSLIDRSRSYSLCDDCIGKFHWITGPACAVCGKAIRGEHGSGRCFDCLQREHVFRKGFSCLTYGLHERELMMGLKYGGEGYIARKCGDMMFDRLEQEIRYGLFSPERAPIDLIVPVPVSRSRLARRGYNQSAFMAEQLMRRWRDAAASWNAPAAGQAEHHAGDGTDEVFTTGWPAVTSDNRAGMQTPAYTVPVCCSGILIRGKDTVMLRSLNPAERVLALEGAFLIRTGQEKLLQGRRVLLVDDIYTTGATADACSRVLLEGGAKEVYLISFASGGNRRPKE